MHVVGSTFDTFMRFEIKGDFFQIKVSLNAQKALYRGIFVLDGNNEKVWLPFKYENLPAFCFSYGHLGHNVKEFDDVESSVKKLPKEKLPYSLALKAESALMGKESVQLRFTARKVMKQCLYIGDALITIDGNINSVCM